MFGKSFKSYVPVYVAIVDGFHLAIRWDCFSEFIGDDIGMVYE